MSVRAGAGSQVRQCWTGRTPDLPNGPPLSKPVGGPRAVPRQLSPGLTTTARTERGLLQLSAVFALSGYARWLRPRRFPSVSVAINEAEQGSQGDPQIQQKRPALDIGQGVINAALHSPERLGIAAQAVHLRPSRDARLHTGAGRDIR